MSLRQHQLGDLALACGHTLPEAQLTYLQIGELNADRSNLILVPTSYGARPDDLAWLAGPVLDSERWCIVIAGAAVIGSMWLGPETRGRTLTAG